MGNQAHARARGNRTPASADQAIERETQRERDKGASGDLVIERELVLATMPRGHDEVRLTLVHAKARGREVSWLSLREHYKDAAGTWRPGRKGISIRMTEVQPIADALRRVLSGEPIEDTSDLDAMFREGRG